MKNTPKAPGDRALMNIRYNYKYRKILGFIDTEVYLSSESGESYISHLPENYYNVSIFFVLMFLAVISMTVIKYQISI